MNVVQTIKNIPSSAKHVAKMAKFTARAKSPELLLGAGIIAGGATVVLACRATLKAKPKLDDLSIKLEDLEHIENVHTLAVANDPHADEEDEHNLAELKKQCKKEKRHEIAVTAVGVSKDFAPAIIVGMVGIGCVLASYRILDKRLLGATVAYESVNAAFNRYRHRVIDKYGEQAERQLYYGETVTDVEYEEEVEDAETGEKKVVKKVKQEPNVEKGVPWHSIYSRTLHNRSYQPGMDVDQVRRIQNYLNDELARKGYVFLNDVYKALELEIDGEYVGVGWLSKEFQGEDYVGDGFIDFGVFGDNVTEQAKLWREGKTNSVILDFNVDGPIYKYVNAVNEMKKDDIWSANVYDGVNRRPYYPAAMHV